MLAFVKLFDFCQKLGFWAIILASDMLASQSGALKMRITVKFLKKWLIGSEPGKVGQKGENILPL